MTTVIAVVFLAVAADPLAGTYPDRNLTPGALSPSVTQDTVYQTICIKGYTDTARHVTPAEKQRVLDSYLKAHPDWPEGPYETDHLISLELGGSNDAANLWPEPYCSLPHDGKCLGAREKDVVETKLHRLICRGEMTLKDAQARIANDWVREYQKK